MESLQFLRAKMIMLKKYKTEDWTKIDDAVEPFMFREPLDDFNEAIQRGIAVTAIEDDEIMACGGVAYVNKEEGVVWVKVSKKCFKQSFRWARTIREVFSLISESLGRMTITTYILEEFCKGERLAKMIGMEKVDGNYEFDNRIYNKFSVVI